MNDAIVLAYRIIGTRLTVYSAWVPSALMGPHSSLRTIDGRHYGRVGTERLPAALEGLKPGSDERIAAVLAWRAERDADAYAEIERQHPGITGRRDAGEVTVTE